MNLFRISSVIRSVKHIVTSDYSMAGSPQNPLMNHRLICCFFKAINPIITAWPAIMILFIPLCDWKNHDGFMLS
jgi:hypothetical protein